MIDNYRVWEFAEAERDRWLNKRPKCCCCDQPIQDERLMDINGELYHIECAFRAFSEDTDDYI